MDGFMDVLSLYLNGMVGSVAGSVCLESEIHEIHEIQSLSRNPLSN